MSYSHTDKDFKRCLFNPLGKSKLATEPRLQALFPLMDEDNEDAVVFTAEVPREKLLKYILCMYDPESPLLKEPSLEIRKIQAAQIAGYDLEGDSDWLEKEVFSCKNAVVITVLVRYLMLRKSREFAGIMADEQTYWEFVKRLMEPIGKADKERDEIASLDIKTKLSEAKEVLNQRLTNNWKKFFNDDDAAAKQATQVNVWTPEAAAGIIA